MPLNQSTIDEKVRRVRSDIAKELPGSNPFTAGLLNALSVALAGMSDELSTEISQLLEQIFPITTTGEFLEQWASIRALTRSVATKSSGTIVCTGTVSTSVPLSTTWTSDDNISYISLALATIINESISVASITRSGETATVTTSVIHNFATGQIITISGAVETEYNGNFAIIVNSTTEFEYTVTGSPATPATGTILSDADMAVVTVESAEVGSETNALSGQKLEITSAIAGLDNTAFVSISNIEGGTDLETDDEFRERFLEKLANEPTAFSDPDVINAVRLVPQATRVKVKRADPSAGKVKVLFMTDNEISITPTAAQIAQAKANIIAIADVTVDDPNVDITVIAPTTVPTNFLIATISPNTSTMKTAIIDNLKAFFADGVEIERIVFKDEYLSAIFNTVDPATGASLNQFTLTTPTSDLPVTTDEVITLGTVSFSV